MLGKMFYIQISHALDTIGERNWITVATTIGTCTAANRMENAVHAHMNGGDDPNWITRTLLVV